MKARYRLIRRNHRGKTFYCVDTLTGKRTSLRTVRDEEAEQIVLARNQALRQPHLNLQIARAYLMGSDNGIATRTWQHALDALIATKSGANQARWRYAARDQAFSMLRERVILETEPEVFLRTLRKGTVSTNVFLRRLQNFCVDMNWLPWPLIPKRQWPRARYKEKRGITWEEHQAILSIETNPEWRAFYQTLWFLGGSQSDVATLQAEDIDRQKRTIVYSRHKTGAVCHLSFGEPVEVLLRSLPERGPLFPRIGQLHEKHRAKQFRRHCLRLGLEGISLHSYRYAWAERAKVCGCPERFAQLALGHNSKAVHRAYAKKAEVTVPSLDEYEQKVLPLAASGHQARAG